MLFCDVSGFTAYCDEHPPETVVAQLQHLVEAFEELAVGYGMEKIKTVGDAFLATGGLLLPHPDPVMSALSCAFDIDRGGPTGAGSLGAALRPPCRSRRRRSGWPEQVQLRSLGGHRQRRGAAG